MRFILLVCLFIQLHNLSIAQESYIVTGVSFSGNKTFSSGELKTALSIFPTNGFQRTILRREPFLFSHELLDEDLERLIKYYQKEGFINIKISPPVFTSDHKKQHVKVDIALVEGIPVLVDSVSYVLKQNSTIGDSIKALSIVQKSLKKLNLKNGIRFRDAAVLDDLRFIVDELGKVGFAYAAADYELTVKENHVDLNWTIKPGPTCNYGNIKISGNTRVSTKTIARQVGAKEGKPFNVDELKKTQWQIYELSTFDFVTVVGLLDKNQTSEIPIKVEVREGIRTMARFGGGYGREEKLRAFASFTRLGFLGGVRRVSLFLNTSALEPYNVNLRFTQPAFVWPRIQLELNPFLLKQNEPAYTARRYGGNLGFTYKLNRKSQGSITYTLEKVEQELFDSAAPTDEDTTALYNKSYVTFGLLRDTSLPIFEPNSGFFSSVQYTISGIGFSSQFRFNKLVLELRHYLQVRFGSVLALRGKIGWIDTETSDGFVPPEERFYSGGSNSVRGWLRQELGPKDEDGTPLGGKTLFEGSVEWRQQFIGSFGAVAFLDFGNVWLEEYSFKPAEIRYAAGVGLRYKTPIGPMRFDLARPIFDEESKIQWHLSVGHAF